MDSKDKGALRDVVDGLDRNGSKDKGTYDLAVEVTGLKRSTVQSMVCRREIPHTRLGVRLVVFSRADLEAWMRERAVPVKAVP